MTRIQVACYSLMASAFVLAGLLVVNLDLGGAPAQAEMVIARENFTLMTARTRENEESLFVLDNSTGRLLIYSLNAPRRQLQLVANANVGEIFTRGEAAGGDRRR
jgi:hypothetical protein